MRVVPWRYVARSLWVRRVTTLLTAAGMALVVYVFATVLMMSEGIRAALVATGQPDHVVVLRKGAATEVNSGIERWRAAVVESLPGVSGANQGAPLASPETVVLNNLVKRASGKPSNVTMRGTSAAGIALRAQVQLRQGRMFRPGAAEVVAGAAVARGFEGVELGGVLRFGGRDWTVVGIFDAGGTAFDSEIWLDAEPLMAAFRRQSWSSVILQLDDPRRFDELRERLEADPRLNSLEAKREQQYYAEQSRALANFIRILGTSLAVIFSIGAVVGAAITMYGSVAARTGEIGSLRALGFRRGAILLAFLAESLLLGLAGGLAGVAAASTMQVVNLSTTNFSTFAELAFRFTFTPAVALQSMAFALAMGALGGLAPAWRAARMKIVDCLRAA